MRRLDVASDRTLTLGGGMSQTVRKVGPVLDLFSSMHPTWTLPAIADRLSLPRSTARLLVNSLVEIGLLRVVGPSEFRIGSRAIHLDQVSSSRTPLESVVSPSIDDLASQVRETVQLCVMLASDALIVDTVSGSRAVSIQGTAIGDRHPAHSTAAGKILLAHRGASESYALSSGPLGRMTGHTITEPADLLSTLRAARRRGFAVDEEERELGVGSVAAPIHDDSGAVAAALAVVVPIDRFRRHTRDLVLAVVQCAGRMSMPIKTTSGERHPST